MKKRFIVILSIQTVLILLFLAYAFMQKLEADKQKESALISQAEAVKNFMEAEMQRKIAQEKITLLEQEIDSLKKQLKK